jgi:hypothetical protein
MGRNCGYPVLQDHATSNTSTFICATQHAPSDFSSLYAMSSFASSGKTRLRSNRIRKRGTTPDKKVRVSLPASKSVSLMRRDMESLASAVEDQQRNIKSVMSKLDSSWQPLPRFVRASVAEFPSPVRNPPPQTVAGNTEVEELKEQLAQVAEDQKRVLAIINVHERNQVLGADIKDDWELMAREQRIHTDHLARLSKAVMELKTSKRSDALAAAAQIREQAEQRFAEISAEMETVREERTTTVSSLEGKMLEMEKKFKSDLESMKLQHESDFNKLRTDTMDTISAIKKKLDDTARLVQEELDGHHYDAGPGPLPISSTPNRSVSMRSPSRLSPNWKSPQSSTNGSPGRTSSARTMALDEELLQLEQKIKTAQQQMLRGYEM